jgi:small subunit ribosomal protein S21
MKKEATLGSCIMVNINDNNIDKALKRLNKKIRNDDLFPTVKKFEYYTKPSEKRNKKKSFKK